MPGARFDEQRRIGQRSEWRRPRAFCREWPNQEEIAILTRHYGQEDCPDEIGQAAAAFIRKMRG